MSQGEVGTVDISAWATAIATFLLAFVAVFQDWIRAKLWKPKLEIGYSSQPPDAHMTLFSDTSARCYFFLLRVRNSGRCGAQNVELVANRLFKRCSDGTYHRVHSFIPQNLTQSFSEKPVLEAVAPGFEKHFGLGHILYPIFRSGQKAHDLDETAQNDTVFAVDVQFKSNNKNHLLPPGHYAIEVLAGASNMTAPLTRIVTLSHSAWSNDESVMVSQEVKIAVYIPGDDQGPKLPKE